MDLDIQFGELEEAQPESKLRPDRNKHYAVVAYEHPREEDLPIFVDLDVMRDIETHAASDTTVELGGVLLGAQCHDEEGRPFVVVTDSLRAEHYEATKGSFKFTHETWEQISRERDEFPDDLQMVGWYHTHPDWGVFLSGMDMFICDNFFNRELDLALVVDPCRRDRGMFMWTGQKRERIRRTGGFFLMASRFRRQELELFIAQLEGKLTMATDTRFGYAAQPGVMPAPVVNISEQKNPWQATALVGMIGVQLLVVVLLAWRMFAPAGEADEKEGSALTKQVEELTERLDEIEKSNTAAAKERIAQRANEELLTRLAAELGGDSGQLAKSVRELAAQLDEAEESLAESRLARKELDDQVREFTARNEDLAAQVKKRDETIKSARDERDRLRKNNDEARGEIAALKKEIDKLKGGGQDYMLWIYAGVGGAALLLIAVGVVAAIIMRRGPPGDLEGGDGALFAEVEPTPAGGGKEASPADEQRTDGESSNDDDANPEQVIM